MPATQFTTGSADVTGTTYVLQEAISGYTDEAYTAARKLSGTGIVSSGAAGIDPSTETFTGQLRWRTNVNSNINIASLTNSADGQLSTYGTDLLKYDKTVRTRGAQQINMKQVVTQEDGLAKIGRDFGEARAQDEHDAILAILKGVAVAEALRGSGGASGATGTGGQTFTNDPTDSTKGFYVDLGADKLISAVGTNPSGTANLAYVGAQRGEAFLNAFGMAFKDYEPEWAYLVVSPSILASLRSANLVDSTKVTDGNIDFSTIYDGKFRLIQTRANQSIADADRTIINSGTTLADGTDIDGPITSFLVLPGAIALEPLSVPIPVEIQRDAGSYNGGGTTEIWNRWGYIAHPVGYDWIGSTAKFASDAEYAYAVESGTPTAVGSVTSGLNGNYSVTGTWERKTASVLSLGILPIFHS